MGILDDPRLTQAETIFRTRVAEGSEPDGSELIRLLLELFKKAIDVLGSDDQDSRLEAIGKASIPLLETLEGTFDAARIISIYEKELLTNEPSGKLRLTFEFTDETINDIIESIKQVLPDLNNPLESFEKLITGDQYEHVSVTEALNLPLSEARALQEDSLIRLAGLFALKQTVDELVDETVVVARISGASWAEMSPLMHKTQQVIQRKYKPIVDLAVEKGMFPVTEEVVPNEPS
jgi:hypothetical protein